MTMTSPAPVTSPATPAFAPVPSAMLAHTPWGKPDHTSDIAPGIVQVSTPSHGGIILSPERNALVPAELKEASWSRQGVRGYYEEDVDAAIVAVVFPECFGAEAVRTAHTMLGHFAVGERLPQLVAAGRIAPPPAA